MDFVELLHNKLPWQNIEQVELGVFRVGSTFFKRMLKRPDTDLLHYPYEHDKDAVSYKREERERLVEGVLQPLLKTLAKKRF